MIKAFDACAMLAYLRAENGAIVVANLLRDPNVISYAHTINLLEVYYDFLRNSSEQRARQALLALRQDGIIERRDMNRKFIERVGMHKARGRISLADCFCISLAQMLGGEVVTSDHHEFDRLVPLGLCPIQFIR